MKIGAGFEAVAVAAAEGRLRRMRWMATGLLVGVSVLFVGARLGSRWEPGLEWVQAFAEAAMVGALADWFAVVALFRHPFGVRIPHTAILVERQGALAEALGRFVSENFLRREVVAGRLERVDLVGFAVGWLERESAVVARGVCVALPRVLEVLGEERVRGLIVEQLRRHLGAVPLAPMVGRVLGVLTSGGKHEVLLDEALRIAARILDENSHQVMESVERQVPLPEEFFGLNVRRPVAEYVARKMVLALQDFLHSAGTQRGHPVRRRFTERVQRWVEELQRSPEAFAKGEDLKREVLGSPLLAEYAERVWVDLRGWLAEAAAEEGGELEGRVAGVLEGVAAGLRGDAALVARLNGWLREGLAGLVETHRTGFGELIEETVRGWDGVEMAQKLEREVGADLQFIRINGTLIGGLIGVLIHAVARGLR
jgi:uncharacterized membrane-anchored protein YjiN (DUF445 family)